MKDTQLMSKIIDRFKIEPGLILLHHNADIDAVGSAIALKCAYPSFSIGVFQKVSQISKKLFDCFDNVSILQPPEIGDFKTIIILDASTPSQLGISQDLLINPIVIDHHTYNDVWETEYYYCDDSKSSCAELIFEILNFVKFDITPKTAFALLVGVMADTGHFKYANPESFINFGLLLKLSNLTITDIFKFFEDDNTIKISQRIAHLKGAQRLTFRQVNGYLITVSQLSSFEASMCKNFLTLGADVAFVGAQHDDKVRVSSRATNDMVKNGLHLGKLLQNIGYDLLIDGGGHAGAAGANGIGDIEMVLNACMNQISKILVRT